MCLLLDERGRVPHEGIAPGARRWVRMPVYDGQVHALGLTALELRSELLLGPRVLGEHHQSGGVTIDAMYHKGPAFVRAQMIADQPIHRRRLAAPIERDDEQARRLV